MILGSICTRACRLCAVTTGLPIELDWEEPERIGESVEQIGLKRVVIMAVAREDLKDGGAQIFTETIRAVRRRNPFCSIEVLPSDMNGKYDDLKTLMAAKSNF